MMELYQPRVGLSVQFVDKGSIDAIIASGKKYSFGIADGLEIFTAEAMRLKESVIVGELIGCGNPYSPDVFDLFKPKKNGLDDKVQKFRKACDVYYRVQHGGAYGNEEINHPDYIALLGAVQKRRVKEVSMLLLTQEGDVLIYCNNPACFEEAITAFERDYRELYQILQDMIAAAKLKQLARVKNLRKRFHEFIPGVTTPLSYEMDIIVQDCVFAVRHPAARVDALKDADERIGKIPKLRKLL